MNISEIISQILDDGSEQAVPEFSEEEPTPAPPVDPG